MVCLYFLGKSWLFSWIFLDFSGFSLFSFIFLKISWLFLGVSWISIGFLAFPLFLIDFHIFLSIFCLRETPGSCGSSGDGSGDVLGAQRRVFGL